MNDIKSIQAYTDDTFYGTGLVQVDITYNEGVTLTGVTADSYILEDRGSLSPEYGEIKIASATVEGQVVTLEIEDLTDATENNNLIYTGTNAEGSRERNAFGIYCTGNWYRDLNGQIYYGDTDDTTKGYKANKYTDTDGTGYVMGYQPRASLELKLRHTGEEESAALCLADDKGQYNSGGKWQKTIDRQFGVGGFQSFEELGIQIESTGNNSAITDGTQDQYVRGYAYIPDDYDPANGIVFTFQGQGICYWKMPDGSNNAGTAMMYDSATTSWSYTHPGAIVVQLNDRSSFGPGEYYANGYDFVKDDAEVMKYFVDTYGVDGAIVVQGNSRGTMAASMVIKALAGQEYNPMNQRANVALDETFQLDTSEYGFTVDAFVCQNGYFGYQYDEDDWQAVADTNLRVWAIDGEQDTDNYSNITAYAARMTELNGADWAEENVRISGYNSEIYYYWGETDHSTTRVNGWYFCDTPYYGPSAYIDATTGEVAYTQKLTAGTIYKLQGRGKNAVKADYEYVIYGDNYQDWALGVAETSSSSGNRHHTSSSTTSTVTTPTNSNTANVNTKVTQTPAVTVNSNGEAVVEMTTSQINSAITTANTSSVNELVIKPAITGDATKVTVSLPQQSVADLANNGKLAVTVASDLANVTIPNAGLAQLAKENGAVTVSAEAAADNSGAVKIDVSVGGKSVDSLSSGITATLPAANATPGSVMVLVNADGTETIVKKSVVGSDGVSGLLNGSATVKVVDNTKTFSDMNGHWSASFVNFAASRQLFNGTSDTTFSPDLSMSRAMLSTVLWSLEGSTTGNTQSSLSDVASGAWYGEAVNWATSNGLITGYADGTFGGDDSVTREQLAVILYNYANLQGVNTSASGNLAQYNDNGSVSSWASNAMAWAVGAGLISGTGNNTLDPAGTATRAQVAVMMQNMIGLLVGTGK